MHSFPIPVVAIGPGSQPVDAVLETMGLPSDMATFRMPINDSAASAGVYRAALDVLRELLAGMAAVPYGHEPPFMISCADMNGAVLREANEMLGQGEVSVLAPAQELTAQETAFTGIWRVRGPGLDIVEASAFPSVMRDLVLARRVPRERGDPPPVGLMNAPALLAEVRDLSARYRVGNEATVLNLSLLPVTPEDLSFLDGVLGRTGFSILSRGFGNCRITATAYPHVWWVQYFNSMEKLILNSIEIVDLPIVALAAAEDYRDSRLRLAEWIDSLASAR
jgi:hydrogenase-1 operon protein HyaF